MRCAGMWEFNKSLPAAARNPRLVGLMKGRSPGSWLERLCSLPSHLPAGHITSGLNKTSPPYSRGVGRVSHALIGSARSRSLLSLSLWLNTGTIHGRICICLPAAASIEMRRRVACINCFTLWELAAMLVPVPCTDWRADRKCPGSPTVHTGTDWRKLLQSRSRAQKMAGLRSAIDHSRN